MSYMMFKPQSNFDIGKLNVNNKRVLGMKHKNVKINIAHFVYVPIYHWSLFIHLTNLLHISDVL